MTGEPPRRQKKTELIEVRVSHETKQDFLAACQRAGRTASDVVREAVDAFIAADRFPAHAEAKAPANVIAMIPKPIRRKRYLAAVAGAAALASFVALPSVAAPDLKSGFERLDANKDGALSADEYAAGPGGDAKQVTIRPMTRLPPGTTVPQLPTADKPRAMFVIPKGVAGDAPPVRREATHQSFEPKLAPTWDAVRRAGFVLMDANADGKVSLDEYLREQVSALAYGFDRLDADKSGELSEDEYGKLNTSMMSWPTDMDVRYPTTVKVGPLTTPGALNARFAEMDSNGDGAVTREEYLPKP